MIFPLLLAAMQVGPNPTPHELEALPVQRRDKEAQAPAVAELAEPGLVDAADKAISGNAAIVAGNFEQALALFDEARLAATAAGRFDLVSDIDLDHARTLLLLARNADAALELERLRSQLPGRAEVWVMSSVAARREGDLARAQALIEEAAGFAPRDPQVGLEAGMIAYLAGNDEAARRSWLSVVDAAPASDEAKVALEYLAQLVQPSAKQGSTIP